MKVLLAISLLFMTGLASAAPDPETIKKTLEAQPTCGNFVRYDEQNLFLGFGPYKKGIEEPRSPIPAKLRIVPFSGAQGFDIATNDAAIDIVTDGAKAFVLTYSSIEEWDLPSRQRTAEFNTYVTNRTLRYKEHARSMARYKNKLIIAHGRLGVSFFDLGTKRVSNQFSLVKWQLPLESMATGVTIQGKLAYISMDNFSLVDPRQGKPPFRGIIIVDMESEKVVAELDGMDPGATSINADGASAIVSFGGIPIWVFAIDALKGQKIPAPEQRVWKFPLAGNPIGAATLDEKYYYTCFSKAPAHPGENGGWYRKVPLALDRRVLMLE